MGLARRGRLQQDVRGLSGGRLTGERGNVRACRYSTRGSARTEEPLPRPGPLPVGEKYLRGQRAGGAKSTSSSNTSSKSTSTSLGLEKHIHVNFILDSSRLGHRAFWGVHAKIERAGGRQPVSGVQETVWICSSFFLK